MEIKRPESKQPIPKHAKRVFRGVIFDVYQWEQKMYDGTRAIFEKLKRPDTVVIFPVLPDGKIIVAKQDQPGRPESFIGSIGGRVDEGEDILEAAKRELREESGYEAEEFILWNAQHPVGKIDWVIYTFIAKGLRKVDKQKLDPGEKIKLIEITLNELIDLNTAEPNKIGDKELVPQFLEAKFYPAKKKQLEELFKPLEML